MGTTTGLLSRTVMGVSLFALGAGLGVAGSEASFAARAGREQQECLAGMTFSEVYYLSRLRLGREEAVVELLETALDSGVLRLTGVTCSETAGCSLPRLPSGSPLTVMALQQAKLHRSAFPRAAVDPATSHPDKVAQDRALSQALALVDLPPRQSGTAVSRKLADLAASREGGSASR